MEMQAKCVYVHTEGAEDWHVVEMQARCVYLHTEGAEDWHVAGIQAKRVYLHTESAMELGPYPARHQWPMWCIARYNMQHGIMGTMGAMPGDRFGNMG